MKNLFVKFIKDDSGATAIEYGLVAAGISFAIIAIVQGIANNTTSLFNALRDGHSVPLP